MHSFRGFGTVHRPVGSFPKTISDAGTSRSTTTYVLSGGQCRGPVVTASSSTFRIRSVRCSRQLHRTRSRTLQLLCWLSDNNGQHRNGRVSATSLPSARGCRQSDRGQKLVYDCAMLPLQPTLLRLPGNLPCARCPWATDRVYLDLAGSPRLHFRLRALNPLSILPESPVRMEGSLRVNTVVQPTFPMLFLRAGLKAPTSAIRSV